MEDLLVQCGCIAGGFIALHIFYRAVETSWPQSYMAASDFTGQYVSSSLITYTLYRALPVFAVAFFVAGSLRSADRVDAWAPIGIAALHAASTSGLSIWERRSEPGYATVWVFGVISNVAVIGAAISGVVFARFDAALELLPNLGEIATTLWTAGIAAVLGAYLLRISGRPRKEAYDVSRASIPAELWTYAREQAIANQADPALVKSIMVVENLQRPRWLRRFESVKAKLGLTGTYGIMQVEGRDATDDLVSIQKACRSHLKGVRPKRGYGDYADAESVYRLALTHNPDPKFAATVANFHWRIEQEELLRRAHLEVERYPDGSIAVRNAGGGSALDVRVVRVNFLRIEEVGPEPARAQIAAIASGSTVEHLVFEPIELSEVTPVDRQQLYGLNPNHESLIHLEWTNEDFTPGGGRWSSV